MILLSNCSTSENAVCNGPDDDRDMKEEEVYQDLCAIQRTVNRGQVLI